MISWLILIALITYTGFAIYWLFAPHGNKEIALGIVVITAMLWYASLDFLPTF